MVDTDRSRKELYDSLSNRIKTCRLCDGLNLEGTESAPGYGNLFSRVMIIGQSLCKKCMESQIPFTGGSGRLLDRAFERAGINKKDIFITNVVHCHTPGNRRSLPHEVKNCRGFLIEELTLVRPETVIPLGQDAVVSILGSEAWPTSIGKSVSHDNYSVYPMYHPSYVLRQGAGEKYVIDLARLLKRSI